MLLWWIWWSFVMVSFSETWSFLRSMHDWELESLLIFMELIYCVPMRSGVVQLCWKPANWRGFEVGGYYCELITTHKLSFPCKRIWKSKVTSRVAFFSWTAALGRTFTIDNLHKRHLPVDHLVLYVYLWWEDSWPFGSSLSNSLWVVVYCVWWSVVELLAT